MMTTGPKEPSQADADHHGNDSWPRIPALFRSRDAVLPTPWDGIFGPLRQGSADDLVVVAQFGQSIDARVATASGHSHYINGPEGLAHLHRLRALVDAVVIGVGTANADDPQLTVRRVAGQNPARVVIDPMGRLNASARLLAGDGAARIVVARPDVRLDLPAGVDVLRLPAADGHIAPRGILAALAERGFRRILVEGGADTVSRFLAARCLDRLHVLIAPLILGSGRASVTLPEVARVDQALRVPMRVHALGTDVLIDCDLGAQRIPIGVARRST